MPVDPGPTAAPVVPGYVLEELLGSGGSGQVWRARPRGGGDPVAVKVLVRGDPARQVREAALLAELDHPHLVRLHRVVRREVRGGPAEVSLVLDLLAGGSLASLLARRGRLRPGEVVTAIAPVAAALAQAHERGIVHGDLSPGNVVFTAEGRPVLTDLGTARLVGDAARAEVTPAYVDPVVACGGAPGPASDVFGVAAAAFHALTGIAPWNAADPDGTLSVASGGHLPHLALLAPDTPEELVRVVERGLSAEPHLRGTAAAFALDLRHACRPEPVRLPAPGVPDEVLGETGRGPRTELTHQVAGRRSRSAHAAPAAPGRLARVRVALTRGAEERIARSGDEGHSGPLLRRWGTSVAALLVLAGALVGAAWVGASWGRGGAGEPVPAADAGQAAGTATGPVEARGTERAADGTATAEATGDPGAAEPGGVPGPPPSPAPRPAPASAPPAGSVSPTAPGPTAGSPPASSSGAAAGPRTEGAEPSESGPGGPPLHDLDAWAALVADLYERRAGAFAAADASGLCAVYTPDSPLVARDAEQVAALAAAGRTVAGFAPAVRRVTSVTGDSERVALELVDEVPAYRVVATASPGGPPVQEVTGRGAAEVRMTLLRTGEGWRIADAARSG